MWDVVYVLCSIRKINLGNLWNVLVIKQIQTLPVVLMVFSESSCVRPMTSVHKSTDILIAFSCQCKQYKLNRNHQLWLASWVMGGQMQRAATSSRPLWVCPSKLSFKILILAYRRNPTLWKISKLFQYDTNIFCVIDRKFSWPEFFQTAYESFLKPF